MAKTKKTSGASRGKGQRWRYTADERKAYHAGLVYQMVTEEELEFRHFTQNMSQDMRESFYKGIDKARALSSKFSPGLFAPNKTVVKNPAAKKSIKN